MLAGVAGEGVKGGGVVDVGVCTVEDGLSGGGGGTCSSRVGVSGGTAAVS